jgi:hypothetical protein
MGQINEERAKVYRLLTDVYLRVILFAILAIFFIIIMIMLIFYSKTEADFKKFGSIEAMLAVFLLIIARNLFPNRDKHPPKQD